MPPYELVSLDNGDTRIVMENASYWQHPGYPQLPMLTFTFALPPGSEAVNTEVTGIRSGLPGSYSVIASLPATPLGGPQEQLDGLYALYEENRARVYSGEERMPDYLGKIHATGERREYSMVTVAVFPFAYDPLTGNLSVADYVTISVSYTPVDGEHAEFISRFISTGTASPDVPEHVYNKDQAREWYRPSARLLTGKRMLIITTDGLKDLTDGYKGWRESNGYTVTVATLAEIESSSSGDDTPHKIRNYLRERVADYDYLFVIGHHADVPMRVLSPFNNGNAGWWEDMKWIPSDIYYGELSKPDDQSWNKDGDTYIGEALTAGGFEDPQDAPEMGMEIHVGRINSSLATTIPDILEKTMEFASDSNRIYKEASVLAGGILWYDNENGTGWAGYDGAFQMELLQTNGIINGSRAITLYEKDGDGPSEYDCDVPFTRDNLKSELKNNDVGIFVENNHGWKSSFSRCVWNDDGDGVPYESEYAWLTGLDRSDAFMLNSDKRNVAFLMSCLNGYPEDANCLAQALLNYGSVGVVAHTRSGLGRRGWEGPGNGGMNTLYHYLLDNYLKKSTYANILGPAVDAARLEYFNFESGPSKYLNTYEHIIFGDPAINHYGGTVIAIEEKAPEATSLALSVDANHTVHFNLPAAGKVQLEVWDVAGRRVETLLDGNADAGAQTIEWNTAELPCGSYFVTLRTGNITRSAKAVVTH